MPRHFKVLWVSFGAFAAIIAILTTSLIFLHQSQVLGTATANTCKANHGTCVKKGESCNPSGYHCIQVTDCGKYDHYGLCKVKNTPKTPAKSTSTICVTQLGGQCEVNKNNICHKQDVEKCVNGYGCTGYTVCVILKKNSNSTSSQSNSQSTTQTNSQSTTKTTSQTTLHALNQQNSSCHSKDRTYPECEKGIPTACSWVGKNKLAIVHYDGCTKSYTCKNTGKSCN